MINLNNLIKFSSVELEFEQQNLESSNLNLKGYAYISDLKFRGKQEISSHFEIFRKNNPLISIGKINVRYRGIGFPSGEPRPQVGYLFKSKKQAELFAEEALRETLRYVLLKNNYARAFIQIHQDHNHVCQALKLHEACSTTTGEYVFYPPRIQSKPYIISVSEFLKYLLVKR